MALSADSWLRIYYADPTCGGTGSVATGVVKQACPDCQGSGLNEQRIAEDTPEGVIPTWVLEQRTIHNG